MQIWVLEGCVGVGVGVRKWAAVNVLFRVRRMSDVLPRSRVLRAYSTAPARRPKQKLQHTHRDLDSNNRGLTDGSRMS
jgi:hypothetical protein